MKITKPLPVIRYLLLAWLIIGMAGIMVIPFLSPESLRGLVEAFRSMQKFIMGGVFAMLVGYFTYKWRDCVEKLQSRALCTEAHQALVRQFNSRPLEGADTKECRRLRSELRITLDKHCRNYPSESGFSDIVQYRDYLKRLEKVKKVH